MIIAATEVQISVRKWSARKNLKFVRWKHAAGIKTEDVRNKVYIHKYWKIK